MPIGNEYKSRLLNNIASNDRLTAEANVGLRTVLDGLHTDISNLLTKGGAILPNGEILSDVAPFGLPPSFVRFVDHWKIISDTHQGYRRFGVSYERGGRVTFVAPGTDKSLFMTPRKEVVVVAHEGFARLVARETPNPNPNQSYLFDSLFERSKRSYRNAKTEGYPRLRRQIIYAIFADMAANIMEDTDRRSYLIVYDKTAKLIGLAVSNPTFHAEDGEMRRVRSVLDRPWLRSSADIERLIFGATIENEKRPYLYSILEGFAGVKDPRVL